jgi:hypothetical protein
MQLKRWESPRREGRNDKGRGGSARKRQLKKQRQMLRQKLRESNKTNNSKNNRQGEEKIFSLFFTHFVHTTHKFPSFLVRNPSYLSRVSTIFLATPDYIQKNLAHF